MPAGRVFSVRFAAVVCVRSVLPRESLRFQDSACGSRWSYGQNASAWSETAHFGKRSNKPLLDQELWLHHRSTVEITTASSQCSIFLICSRLPRRTWHLNVTTLGLSRAMEQEAAKRTTLYQSKRELAAVRRARVGNGLSSCCYRRHTAVR